jgi:hypothetical protein
MFACTDGERWHLAAAPPMLELRYVNEWVTILGDAHRFSPQGIALIESTYVSVANWQITASGLFRIMSLPSPEQRISVPIHAVRFELQWARRELDPAHCPGAVSQRDDGRFALSFVHGHNQLADLYFLSRLHSHGGWPAKPHHGAAPKSVRGALPHHVLLQLSGRA